MNASTAIAGIVACDTPCGEPAHLAAFARRFLNVANHQESRPGSRRSGPVRDDERSGSVRHD